MAARRIDGNQAAIRKVWVAMGGSWLTIAPDRGGEPDALVGWQGQDQLIEIKSAKGKVQENQAKWHASWRGRPVAIVRSIEDLTALFSCGPIVQP